MKKSLLIAMLATAAVGVQAQETYESAALATSDLNGTARYIGMGGAMEALGADISTISSNPAGLGLFRRSWVGVSGGFTSQSDGTGGINDNDGGHTNVDLNQAGFVYTIQTRSNSWFNLAFNYSKSRNFNQILNAMANLNNASNSKLSYVEYYGNWAGEYVSDQAVLNKDVVLDNMDDGYSSAQDYTAFQKNHGYISNFDFNISGNIHDRVFLGLTLGLKDVNYHGYNFYDEILVDVDDAERGYYETLDQRDIDGTGFDIKFGAIFRPIESSPFRIGVYVHTPTWYDLTATIDKGVHAYADDYNFNTSETTGYTYDYKITTPWKLGVSMGHTIGNSIALGATYEFADYSAINNKIVTGYDYDGYSDYTSDEEMNRNTDRSLKAVHTLKLGVEVKPVPDVAIRMGYNYVSAMYNDNASKDYTIDSNYSVGHAVATYDYTNWKSTNRLTFGLGFTLSRNWNLDLSYQYSIRKGDYHPFEDVSFTDTYYDDSGSAYTATDTNIGTVCEVKDRRHQLNCTLGYRF